MAKFWGAAWVASGSRAQKLPHIRSQPAPIHGEAYSGVGCPPCSPWAPCGLKKAAAHREPLQEHIPGQNCSPWLWWNRRAAGAASCGALCWNSAVLKDGVSGTEPHQKKFLGQLLPVGSLCRLCLGRTASSERKPTWSRGREVAQTGIMD